MTDDIENVRTEADAVAERTATPVVLTSGGRDHLLTPPEWTSVRADLETFDDVPVRFRGDTTVDNSASLIDAVAQQSPRATYFPIVYADERVPAITAVLNHQQVTDPPVEGQVTAEHQQDVTGWGDHRVVLALERSPEWNAWLAHNNEMMSQDAFALFIEERLAEITRGPSQDNPAPSQADMLDLAQTFQANVTARFDRGIRLESGQTQLTYTEDVQASAGQSKEMRVPEEFLIAVRPFRGADPVMVRCRLRYRVGQGHLKLGYILVRPDLTESTIFDEECAKVAAALQVPVIRGKVPAALTPQR